MSVLKSGKLERELLDNDLEYNKKPSNFLHCRFVKLWHEIRFRFVYFFLTTNMLLFLMPLKIGKKKKEEIMPK